MSQLFQVRPVREYSEAYLTQMLDNVYRQAAVIINTTAWENEIDDVVLAACDWEAGDWILEPGTFCDVAGSTGDLAAELEVFLSIYSQVGRKGRAIS